MTSEGQKIKQLIAEATDSIDVIERAVERSDTVVCCDGIPIGIVFDVIVEASRVTNLVVDVSGRKVRVPIGAVARASYGRVSLMLQRTDIAILSTALVDSDCS